MQLTDQDNQKDVLITNIAIPPVPKCWFNSDGTVIQKEIDDYAIVGILEILDFCYSADGIVNPKINDLSKEIIRTNKREFECIKSNKDPRIPAAPNWINADEAIQIYKNLLDEIGGTFSINSKEDIKFTINSSIFNYVGVPSKTIMEKICKCADGLRYCVHESVAVQYCTTIFLLLCRLNNIDIKFDVGEIYDIFNKEQRGEVTYDEFKKFMIDHVIGFGG